METLVVFTIGMILRFTVVPLVLLLPAVLLLAIVMGMRGAETLWHRTIGFTAVHPPLWKAT